VVLCIVIIVAVGAKAVNMISNSFKKAAAKDPSATSWIVVKEKLDKGWIKADGRLYMVIPVEEAPTCAGCHSPAKAAKSIPEGMVCPTWAQDNAEAPLK